MIDDAPMPASDEPQPQPGAADSAALPPDAPAEVSADNPQGAIPIGAPTPDRPHGEHWLENPKNVRRLALIGAFVLVVLIVIDFFVEHHPHFSPEDGIDIDTKPEFFVAFGFLSCVLQVFIAKALARIVKRKIHYYEKRQQ